MFLYSIFVESLSPGIIEGGPGFRSGIIELEGGWLTVVSLSKSDCKTRNNPTASIGTIARPMILELLNKFMVLLLRINNVRYFPARTRTRESLASDTYYFI
ncbi:hypothetical protein SBDP1_810015 [Syntrophobacter sp. SbD1]|nr:hypothetical protein SBDP1_810015 [Syntrophobacter sp. SbD1]